MLLHLLMIACGTEETCRTQLRMSAGGGDRTQRGYRLWADFAPKLN